MSTSDLKWSPPRNVQTRFGERIVRNAEATDAFMEMWRTNESVLRKQGFSVRTNDRSGKLEVSLWQNPGAADAIERIPDQRPAFDSEQAAVILRIARKHIKTLPSELLCALGLEDERGPETLTRTEAESIAQGLSFDDDDIPF